jgi:glutaminase
VCKAISTDFGLHSFADRSTVGSAIRHHHRASDVGSKRVRTASERAWLKEHGARISITELQGALHFASSERVIRKLAETAGEVDDIIVDFRRVTHIDAAGMRLLLEAFAGFGAAGCRICITRLDPVGALATFADRLTAEHNWIALAPDLDAAIETAEDRLLAKHYESEDTTRYALASIDLLKDLDAEAYRALEDVVAIRSYAAGDRIVAEGDPAEAFFVIVSGTASVSIALDDGRRRRLASLGPGSAFGEGALVDGGVRSADVHADGSVVIYAFPVAGIRRVAETQPRVLSTILSNMVRDLSYRLTQANREIRSLE